MRTIFAVAANPAAQGEREPDPLKGTVEVPATVADAIGAFVADLAASGNPAVERAPKTGALSLPAYRLAAIHCTLPTGERAEIGFGFRGALTVRPAKGAASAHATLPALPADATAEEQKLYASLMAKLAK